MEINFSSYLTWSGEDERRPLVCTDVGSASVPPRSAYPPAPVSHPDEYVSVATGRTVNEYQLVYVTRGRGTLRTNGKTWDIVPGTAILVFPRVRHAYGPDAEQGWDERWVGFKGSYIEALRADGTISSERPVFSVGLDERLLVHFEELFGAVRAAEPFFQMRAGARIMLLLAELLSRERKTAQADGTAALVEKAKFLIAEKAGGSLSVDGVAGELGVGQARLYESFKAFTGMTPYRYFIHLKVNRAKELLSVPGTTVKEVAFLLGFDDQYYFSRLFKKKTGVSPSDWAERVKPPPVF
ncbi:MAG: hypothetical protein A2413_17435 [Treponema sp. RIFOXYC1_FULL_61_9]|nr:MAG: hypothetical protein A2413_17435 [Treponema sp. RIFOXYC1_FULL_61_9]